MKKRSYLLLMLYLLFSIIAISSFVIAGAPCGSSGINDPTCKEVVESCTWSKHTLYNCAVGSEKCLSGGSCGNYRQCDSCGGISQVSYPYNCYKDSCTGNSVCNNMASIPSDYKKYKCWYISDFDYTSCQDAGGGVGLRYPTNPTWSSKSGSSCSNIATPDDGPYDWSTAGEKTGCCDFNDGPGVGAMRLEQSTAPTGDCPAGYNDGDSDKGCCLPAGNSDCFHNSVCYSSTTVLGNHPINAYCNLGIWQGGDDSLAACDAVVAPNSWELGSNEVLNPNCCGDDNFEYINIQREHNSGAKGDISWINEANPDRACCDDSTDNVGDNNYCISSMALSNGIAVETGSTTNDIKGVSYEGVTDPSWMECDLYADTYCNNIGNGEFVFAGEPGVGEYQAGSVANGGDSTQISNAYGYAETCGDDAVEYFITTKVFYSNGTFLEGPYHACCDNPADCVNATGHCLTEGVVPYNDSQVCSNNVISTCDNETWTHCDQHGDYECTYDGISKTWKYELPDDAPPECCNDGYDNDCDKTCEYCESKGEVGCDHCYNCTDCYYSEQNGCEGCFPVDPCASCSHPEDSAFCLTCFDDCFDCKDSNTGRCAGCGGNRGGIDEEDSDCILINGTIFEEVSQENADKGYNHINVGRYYNLSEGAIVRVKYEDSLANPPHDYGMEVTDADGLFNISFNSSADYILYADKAGAQVPLSIKFPLGRDQIDLNLYLGLSSECRSTCSIEDNLGRFVCSKDCDGKNGCNYDYTIPNSEGKQVKDLCHDVQEGWRIPFDTSKDVLCCNGEPFANTKEERLPIKVDAESNITDIISYSRLINYQGEVATMYVTLWE